MEKIDIKEHNDHNELNAAFDQVMLVGYTQTLFSIMESRFRLFVVAIDRTACNNGTAPFSNIYHYLLTEINKKEYEVVLDFFRLIRNTVHNNGVYLPTNNPKPRGLTYKGITYRFEYSEPVDYNRHSSELIFYEITPDIINMFEDIILNSERILSIPHIEDPLP
jgi:hypothetical protein